MTTPPDRDPATPEGTSAGPSRLHPGSAAEPMDRIALAYGDIVTFGWSVASGRAEVDARLLELTGLPPDAHPTPEEWISDVVHPDDGQRLLGQIRASLDPAGDGVLRAEARIVLPSGDIRWIAITARAVFEGDPPRPVSLAGTIQDITTGKATQEALEVSETRYRTLFAAMHEGFTIVELLDGPDGVGSDFLVVESNPAQEMITGAGKIAGRRALEVIGSLDPDWVRRLQRVAESGVVERWELHAPMLGSGQDPVTPTSGRWFDMRASRVGGEGSRQVALAYSDISTRKRLEAEQATLLEHERAAREEAETALKVRDDFLAMVSHELRTPLAAILLWSRLLASGRAEGREREALEIVERNAEMQRALIEDLLMASRAISGNLGVEPVVQPLAPVVAGAVASMRPAAEAAGVVIDLRIEGLPLAAVDADRMAQVVRNLLDNAIRHSRAGGRIAVWLDLARTPGGGAVLRVSDTGDGITAEFLPHIFERFRRGDSADGGTSGHLGLGLSLSHDIVELHGGQITAASDGPGHGAVFTVTLPPAR